MRNKAKQRLKQRHEEFKKNLNDLYEKFDKDYPGWRERPDADYIKQRLRKTAKLQQKNKHRKKTKLIRKNDFTDWPFTVDEIIIVQTSKKMISCIVKKTSMGEYALNGLAESGLKLKSVFAAGIAIKGKSISKFIKMGLDL